MKELTNSKGHDLLVQFSGHLRPFLLKRYICDQLDCLSGILTVEMIEAEPNGRPLAKPIRFSFEVNLETWQADCKSSYSEQILALIDEFMQDCPDQLRQEISDVHEQRKEMQRKLAEFTFPAQEIREGILISFSEVMTDESRYKGFPEYGHKWQNQERTFYIDDLYCPNPECDCRDVYLSILEGQDEDCKLVLSQSILGQLSLDGKKLEIKESRSCSKSRAKEAVRQWLQETPNALKRFKWRYDQIRKAAKRILKKSQKIPIIVKSSNPPVPAYNYPVPIVKDAVSSLGAVGRNDPCPCGSGRKYKKCCLLKVH
jgi:hypothetical protein